MKTLFAVGCNFIMNTSRGTIQDVHQVVVYTILGYNSVGKFWIYLASYRNRGRE